MELFEEDCGMKSDAIVTVVWNCLGGVVYLSRRKPDA